MPKAVYRELQSGLAATRLLPVVQRLRSCSRNPHLGFYESQSPRSELDGHPPDRAEGRCGCGARGLRLRQISLDFITGSREPCHMDRIQCDHHFAVLFNPMMGNQLRATVSAAWKIRRIAGSDQDAVALGGMRSDTQSPPPGSCVRSIRAWRIAASSSRSRVPLPVPDAAARPTPSS